MANTHPKQRVVIGVFILMFGLLALIDNLNIFESINFIHFWPCVFIAIGVLKLQQSDNKANKLIGGCLIAFGFFLTLNFMGVISIQFRDWWPVILIAVGAFIIFKGKHPENVSELEADKSILDITVLMGGNKTVCNAKKFKFGDITAIMGGVELDLRGADIESEAVLDLWASWGGIMIRVPAEWSVVNRGTAIMGAIEDKTSAPAVTTKRLIISGTAIMGGVEIKN